MNNGSVTPTASHFNQVRYSGKKIILARAAHLFYSRRRGRRTNMILYSLFIIIYKKINQTKIPRRRPCSLSGGGLLCLFSSR